MMIVLHQGFDGFDFSIEANIRVVVAEAMLVAKEKAQKEKRPYMTDVFGVKMAVTGGGSDGGYRFRTDTGPLGATWNFKWPHPNDPWGIRVSYKSAPLALYGYKKCVDDARALLRQLGVPVRPDQISISRADYAVDLLLDDFQIDPAHIVCHSNMKKEAAFESRVSTSGETPHYLRIGSMPGMQVAIYDKRRDVMDKGKKEWWEIWNENLAQQGHPPITPESTKGKLHRFELRAGKKFLKEKQGIRTLEDFEKRAGDAFLAIASKVRLITPQSDTNRSRWSNSAEWDLIGAKLRNGMQAMISGVPASRIREIHREELRYMMRCQLVGCSANLAHAEGLDCTDAAQTASAVCATLEEDINADLAHFSEKLAHAREKYAFVGE